MSRGFAKIFWARKKAMLEGERNSIEKQLTELG